MLKSKSILNLAKLREHALMKHIKLKYIIISLIIVSLIATTAILISSKSGDEFDHRVDNWYAVEDWEVEVCSKWGGGAEPQSYSGSGIVAKSVTSGFETVTIQGKKTSYNVENKEKSYMYEAAWFYQPQTGSATYTVYLTKSGVKEKIFEGSSTSRSGDGNYYAKEYTTDPGFTEVLIEYNSKSLSTKIQKTEVLTI